MLKARQQPCPVRSTVPFSVWLASAENKDLVHQEKRLSMHPRSQFVRTCGVAGVGLARPAWARLRHRPPPYGGAHRESQAPLRPHGSANRPNIPPRPPPLGRSERSGDYDPDRFPWSEMVGRRGLEPLTPCASCKCATNCANGPWGTTIPLAPGSSAGTGAPGTARSTTATPRRRRTGFPTGAASPVSRRRPAGHPPGGRSRRGPPPRAHRDRRRPGARRGGRRTDRPTA